MIHVIGCIFLKDDKLLLGKRFANEDCYAGVWLCPSGTQETDETLEQCAIREMKEELGIDITKLKQVAAFPHKDETSGWDFVHNYFLIEEWIGEIHISDEMEDLRYFNAEEIKDLNMPEVDKNFVIGFLKNGTTLFIEQE